MAGDCLKVIIVDDEKIFRDCLRATIDWEAYGLTVCAEARNGVEALAQLEEVRADIALVDINMPFMDGLQLSARLKELYPDIAIIIITGYGEFEYARKAVKIGVKDFILKPYDNDELITVLLRIKAGILKEREKSSIESSKNILARERLFNILISNDCSLSDAEAAVQLNNIGVKTGSLNFVVASIEIDNVFQRWSDAREIALWKFAVSNMLEETVEVDGNHFIFNGPEGRVISLVEADNAANTRELLKQGYQKLCQNVKRYLDFTITIGIGNAYQGFKSIRESYMEALTAIQYKFLLGNNKVIGYEELGLERTGTWFYPNEINEEIIMNLRMQDWEKVRKRLEDLFNYILSKRLSVDYAYAILSGLVSLCLSFIVETGNRIEDVYGEDFQPSGELRNRETIVSIKEWIMDMFKEAMQYCFENRMTKSKKMVDSAKEYIKTQYSNCDLSLEEIANMLYINPGYLRTIFKKETGITVFDYITNVRMQKAKELLGAGNIKLAAISEMTGYSDASYFSKCFKKYFGISPSEYEMTKGNGNRK